MEIVLCGFNFRIASENESQKRYGYYRPKQRNKPKHIPQINKLN